MESDPNYYSILFFFLLSAFFSSSETAFFSLGKIQLKKLELEPDKASGRIVRLLKKPRQLLITILLGNTVANVILSSIAALMISGLIQRAANISYTPVWVMISWTFVMTFLLVVFGELAPKLVALAKAEFIAKKTGVVIEILLYLLYPVVLLLVLISRVFSRKSDNLQSSIANFTSQDLKYLIDSKSANHPLNDNERKIISGIFKFTSVDAKKIMIPRVDIKGVSLVESIEEIKEQIIINGHSRLPVYRDTIDSIVGIVYAKDLILSPGTETIEAILRKPIFVTENTKIQILLNLFRARKTHMAIVVDEYGGTSGLITLEDILEELVGEIVDEYDTEQPELIKLADNEYQASGMLNILDLNQELECSIDPKRYDNLAAFLYDEFNRVPNEKEKLNYRNKLEFVVTKVNGQRIEQVKIVVKDTEDEFSS